MFFNLNQVLATIQGEGSFIGKPSLLIRSQGCNLTCPFCDSKSTWKFIEGTEINNDNYKDIADKIIEYFNNYNLTNVILTGGEPLLHFSNEIYQSFIFKIINQITTIKYIEIETNTTFKLDELDLTFLSGKHIKFNLSPKCLDNNYLKHNIDFLRHQDIDFDIKLVHINDNFIENFCNILDKDIFNRIYILPMSKDRESYLESSFKTINLCLKKGLNFSPREHLVLFDKNNKEFSSFSLV